MLDRAWGGSFRRSREGRHPGSRKPSRVARRPQVETLEGRQLLAASVAPIADVTVPSGLGYQVPVDGSASKATSQTFTVTSSNPDIKATVAKGAFLTLNVTHASSGASDPAFSGAFTYQLFQDLTPNTANRIQSFTNAGGYNSTSFFRVVGSFSGGTGVSDSVIQGGPQGASGSGTNPRELNQQLAFLQPGTVAIANAGANTDGQQFFVTNGPQTALDFGYTIYGQVVSGQSVARQIGGVATTTNASSEKSRPISPVNITTSTVSTTNPNGVIHVDATAAAPGETSTITVTATDPADKTTASKSFKVSVVANTTTVPTTSELTLKPTTFPVAQEVVGTTPTAIQLASASNNAAPTGSTSKVTTQYVLVSQPSHGKITGFDPATGKLTYTPAAGFSGIDTFTYQAVNKGGSPATVPGNVATVAVTVTAKAPINTHAVRVIGNVLIVTPPPTTLKATNTIVLSQVNNPTDATKNVLTVALNGNTDLIQPLVSAIKQVVIYGSKANDAITVAPTVDKTLTVTLDGGHGGKNTIQAGAGPTREHGWFGQNTLTGGTGPNQLIGAAGHVTFKPTATTDEIFAGVPHPGYYNYRSYNKRVSYQIHPPGGTFYKFVNGHLTAIPTPKAHGTKT